MKNLASIFIVGIILLLVGCNTPANNHQVSRENLAEGFISPPDSIQTSVYWYWISDNISEEGVINDLHANTELGHDSATVFD